MAVHDIVVRGAVVGRFRLPDDASAAEVRAERERWAMEIAQRFRLRGLEPPGTDPAPVAPAVNERVVRCGVCGSVQSFEHVRVCAETNN